MSTLMQTPENMRTSDPVRARWGWFLALGILFILAGALALLTPVLTTLTVAIVIGAGLLVAGVFQIIHAFQLRGWRGFGWHLLAGLVTAVGGLLAVLDPLAGAVAITVVLAATFVAQGVAQLVLAFRLRPRDGWGWFVASGVLALVTGVLVMLSITALGILAAVTMLLTGWTYVALALAARRGLVGAFT